MNRLFHFSGRCVLSIGLVVAPLALKCTGAQAFSDLYDFNGRGAGANPAAGVIADTSGNLYGTTAHNGGTGCDGTVFELRSGTAYTKLHTFCGEVGGNQPLGGLIRNTQGNLYGTTYYGGGGTDCSGSRGCGTVFELSGLTLTLLHSFAGGGDGKYPEAGVISDSSGNLYGTASAAGAHGKGIVFRLSPPVVQGGDWSETVLHAFAGSRDGASPAAGLLAHKGANYYGTTYSGGSTSCGQAAGCGTVFRVSADGKEKVLYAFTGGSDGANPKSNLIADTSGNLYGTTYYGGGGAACNGEQGCGTVFELSPPASPGASWTETVLYAFTGGSDGSNPAAGLILSKGDLYGTTSAGGVVGFGAVFELSPPAETGNAWLETVLWSFNGEGGDGATPLAPLLLMNGNLFGTTYDGGVNGRGNVFELPK